MCHVSLRATRRVVLVNSTSEARERCAYPGNGMAAAVGHAVQHQQIERLVDAAVTGDEATIHVGLTDVQRWIDHKAANRAGDRARRWMLPGLNRAAQCSSSRVRPANGRSDGQE